MQEERKPNQIRWFLRAFPLTFCVFILFFLIFSYFLVFATPTLDLSYMMYATLAFATLWSLLVGVKFLHKKLTKFLLNLWRHFYWAILSFCVGSIVLMTWIYYSTILKGEAMGNWLQGLVMLMIGHTSLLIPWLLIGFLAGAVLVRLYRFFLSSIKSRKSA